MNKKFEYIDDNPGSYFGMLVESVEDKKDIKQRKVNESGDLKNFKVFYIRKSDDKNCTETIKAKDENDARKLFKKNNKDVYRIHKVIEESLTEDKFVPKDKMSKKAQKELNDKKRGTWGNTKPVTRVQPNKKAYDRKRDKKIEDESLKENFDIKLKNYKKESDIKDGYTFNFIVNGHPVSMGCWTEDLGDGEYGDFIVDFDDYSQLDFISEDELDDLWEKLGDIIESKILKNETLEESKELNESSDGWDESKLYDLSEILDEIYNLQYEVQNTIRGAYTNAHTYEELGYYVHNLGSNLMDIGDEIMEMEEEDEEDED